MLRLRRLLALLLLLATTVSSAEVVVGELRDGELHHESPLAALVHGVSSGGDHGHEGGGSPFHSHDAEHRHGTGADHCTHQHGTPLASTFTFALTEPVTGQPVTEHVLLYFEHNSNSTLRPPRA